ncbi:MAG: phosphodiester glycosidase family protein [Calditrichaeota bacterium]|nr:MAG: phosphodiester glycosidase family protein [Calditrichota bacterium]MBL1204818.1 phosphodiester glycosidase family protein [Calditrichota bacterium]NOG44647.1 phosphodiester glycosidase family protein [Calditrichota bacterium]
MKITFKTILFIALANILFAQSFQLETVDHNEPVKGVIYKKLLDSNKPLLINFLEIDLNSPKLDIIAITAYDSVAGNETVSSMVARETNQNQKIIAAINADFYEKGGYSTNAFVTNGELVSMPGKTFTTIGFDESDLPFINKINFSANLFTKKKVVKIDGVNKPRETNQLIIYNGFFGPSSTTNQWGTEIDLRLLNKASVNDTLYFVAEELQKGKGNMRIRPGHYVLSGHDAGAELIKSSIEKGDTIKVYISLENMPSKLANLVGGFTQLVTKGKNSAIESYDKVGKNRSHFLFGNHPRTAIAYNKDKTRLYLVTIDGRQASSIGISLPDLANLMIQFGAYDALNLDGGGSTTMVVSDKIVNSPSDVSGERAVSNALMIKLK